VEFRGRSVVPRRAGPRHIVAVDEARSLDISGRSHALSPNLLRLGSLLKNPVMRPVGILPDWIYLDHLRIEIEVIDRCSTAVSSANRGSTPISFANVIAPLVLVLGASSVTYLPTERSVVKSKARIAD
jgi:hypothetical protein